MNIITFLTSELNYSTISLTMRALPAMCWKCCWADRAQEPAPCFRMTEFSKFYSMCYWDFKNYVLFIYWWQWPLGCKLKQLWRIMQINQLFSDYYIQAVVLLFDLVKLCLWVNFQTSKLSYLLAKKIWKKTLTLMNWMAVGVILKRI